MILTGGGLLTEGLGTQESLDLGQEDLVNESPGPRQPSLSETWWQEQRRNLRSGVPGMVVDGVLSSLEPERSAPLPLNSSHFSWREGKGEISDQTGDFSKGASVDQTALSHQEWTVFCGRQEGCSVSAPGLGPRSTWRPATWFLFCCCNLLGAFW